MTYKPVDSAIVMVVGPCIDDTDFKTLEEAIAYNAAGMDVSLIVEKTDGTTAVTAITLTTAGTSDWTHKDGGYYEIEVTAAQNAEEGIAHVRGVCTGVLPFESIHYNVVKANVYDSWIKGTDVLQTDVTQWLGTAAAPPTVAGVPEVDITHWIGTAAATPTVAGVPEVDVTHMAGGVQTVTDLKDFADAGYDPATNKVQGVVLVDTTTTNTDLVSAASVVNEWETQSQADPTGFHVNVLEIGGTAQTANDNGADINAILADTNELQGDWTNTGRLDTILDTIAEDTTTDIPALIADVPTVAEFEARSIVAADYVVVGDTLAAVTTVTNLTNAPTNGDLTATMKTSVNTEAKDVLTVDTIADSYATDGNQPTIAQAILAIQQMMQDKSISGTTLTVKKPDGSTTAMTFTLDSATTPTSITRAT